MKEVIEHINKTIADSLQQLQPTTSIKTYGLAESVAVRDEDSQTLPAVILPSGECFNVYGLTDKRHVVLYHRLADISFQEDAGASFGAGRGYSEAADVSIIVFGKRERISQYQMEQIVRKAIAAREDCTLVRSDFNSLQVFANEYQGVTYFLTPGYFLFKINYRITSTYNARCANIE